MSPVYQVSQVLPAAPGYVAPSHLFENNNAQMLLGVNELLLAEPVRRTSFFDAGYRHRSAHQYVQ